MPRRNESMEVREHNIAWKPMTKITGVTNKLRLDHHTRIRQLGDTKEWAQVSLRLKCPVASTPRV